MHAAKKSRSDFANKTYAMLTDVFKQLNTSNFLKSNSLFQRHTNSTFSAIFLKIRYLIFVFSSSENWYIYSSQINFLLKQLKKSDTVDNLLRQIKYRLLLVIETNARVLRSNSYYLTACVTLFTYLFILRGGVWEKWEVIRSFLTF